MSTLGFKAMVDPLFGLCAFSLAFDDQYKSNLTPRKFLFPILILTTFCYKLVAKNPSDFLLSNFLNLCGQTRCSWSFQWKFHSRLPLHLALPFCDLFCPSVKSTLAFILKAQNLQYLVVGNATNAKHQFDMGLFES